MVAMITVIWLRKEKERWVRVESRKKLFLSHCEVQRTSKNIVTLFLRGYIYNSRKGTIAVNMVIHTLYIKV